MSAVITEDYPVWEAIEKELVIRHKHRTGEELRTRMTVSTIATYRCRVEGWDWTYDLTPVRLVIDGRGHDEYQHFEVELEHCSPILDHGSKAVLVRNTAWFWKCALVIWFVALLILGGTLAFGFVFRIDLPGGLQRTDLITFAFVGFLAVAIFTVFGFVHFCNKRVIQKSISLKRHSDGGHLITLSSALGAADTSFDEFEAEVVAAIKRALNGTLPPPTSIRKS